MQQYKTAGVVQMQQQTQQAVRSSTVLLLSQHLLLRLLCRQGLSLQDLVGKR